MGFFDRMGNLGKGLVKVWSDPETRKRERERRMSALEAELDKLMEKVRPEDDAPAPTSYGDPQQALLAKLERAHRNGILTDEEYRTKRSQALDDGPPASLRERSSASAAPGNVSDSASGASPDDDPYDDPKPVKRTL